MNDVMKNAKIFYAWVLATGLFMSAMQVSAAALPDFREIVKENSPAVVKILVEASAPRAGGSPDMDQVPEYLRRFFEFRGQPQQPQQRRQQMAMGSGFIISKDGFVVTNNHVVESADKITVRMNDRREFEAELIGTDPRSDLALLKIEGEAFPRLSLGNASDLDVGEWVLAIGSPFGLDYSVTAGIVSAKGRSLPTDQGENYVPFIQTDVAINPGNSGGPLFNLDGEVVGVNSQIYTRSGGSIGLSFAIPVNVVRNVVGQLKETGEVTRGWLGVSIQDVDKNLAESFGLDKPTGALVAQVSPGGPAEEGGLEPGDIILRFDGADIRTSGDLPHVVGLVAPGTRVKVDIMRDRKSRTLRVKVGGLEANDNLAVGGTMDGKKLDSDRLGMLIAAADPQELERGGLSSGVVVREVRPDSPAARAGVQPGDIITLVGSAAVNSVAAYQGALEDLAAGDSVPLRLIRDGAPRFIGLRLDD